MDQLLDPELPHARYVTTAIHVQPEVRPEYLLTPWYRQPLGSDRRHFSLLHQWMGGYYPVAGGHVFRPTKTLRLYDSRRDPAGRLVPGSPRTVTMPALSGIPAASMTGIRPLHSPARARHYRARARPPPVAPLSPPRASSARCARR